MFEIILKWRSLENNREYSSIIISVSRLLKTPSAVNCEPPSGGAAIQNDGESQ